MTPKTLVDSFEKNITQHYYAYKNSIDLFFISYKVGQIFVLNSNNWLEVFLQY
jgi:hypothetical protein